MKRLRISEFCETGSGGTPSRSVKDYFEGGTIPWIKSGELAQPEVETAEEYISEKGLAASPAKLLRPGAILIAMYGATVGQVSRLAIQAATNQAICHIYPDESVCLRDYLYRVLKSSKEVLLAKRVGGGQPNISQAIVRDLEIPLPPLAEQKRIAGILDAADALRAKRRAALAQLDALAQSLFLDLFGDPVTNPKGWEVSSLNDVSRKITDGTHKTPTYTESGVEFLSAKDLKDGEVRWNTGKFISPEEHAQLIKRCNPEKGDLLLAKSGSLGSIALIDCDREFSLFESLCLIKVDVGKIDARFLVATIRNPSMQVHLLGKNKGVAIRHLHLVDVRGLTIPLPPLPLQQQFAAAVEAIERQKVRHREQLAGLDALFASLQHRAFRGEL